MVFPCQWYCCGAPKSSTCGTPLFLRIAEPFATLARSPNARSARRRLRRTRTAGEYIVSRERALQFDHTDRGTPLDYGQAELTTKRRYAAVFLQTDAYMLVQRMRRECSP